MSWRSLLDARNTLEQRQRGSAKRCIGPRRSARGCGRRLRWPGPLPPRHALPQIASRRSCGRLWRTADRLRMELAEVDESRSGMREVLKELEREAGNVLQVLGCLWSRSYALGFPFCRVCVFCVCVFGGLVCVADGWWFSIADSKLLGMMPPHRS